MMRESNIFSTQTFGATLSMQGLHVKAMSLWRLICTFNSRAQLSKHMQLSTSVQLLDANHAIFDYITKITVDWLNMITS